MLTLKIKKGINLLVESYTKSNNLILINYLIDLKGALGVGGMDTNLFVSLGDHHLSFAVGFSFSHSCWIFIFKTNLNKQMKRLSTTHDRGPLAEKNKKEECTPIFFNPHLFN